MLFVIYVPELIRIIRMSGSRTARILALVVLLLAAAPLGSLYYICFSFLSTGIYYVPSNQMVAVPLKTIATTAKTTGTALVTTVYHPRLIRWR